VALPINQSATGASGYTHDGYTIKASSEYPGGAFNASSAFTNTNSSDYDTWISGVSDYAAATGLPVSITANTNKFGENGSWLEIKLPVRVKLQYHQVFTRRTHITERIKKYNLWASNTGNDLDWVKLESSATAAANYTDTQPHTSHVNSNILYQYYAIQITQIETLSLYGYTNIGEWELYGVPEYDPDAHGTDVIARSIPSVPNTDWLEVYYDGKDYGSMPSTITDKSGNGVTGTPTNVTFDSTWKAFTFDGSGDDIQSGNIGLSGDQSITVSLWFRYNSIPTGRQDIFGVGKPGTASQFGIATYTPGTYLYTGGNDIYNTSYDLVTDTNWHHITAVYRGGTPSTTTMALYLDSVNIVSQLLSSSASQAANFDSSNCKAFLGNNANVAAALNGKIANFRLFNRALSGDEIWQLYAYQKDNFQVSPDVVTFKGGRLGIGTREPKAPLDVMGIPYGPGARPVFFATNNSTSSETITAAGIFTNDLPDAHINVGDCYDGTTGRFTAKIAGVYMFGFNVNVVAYTSSRHFCQTTFYLNGTNVNRATTGRGLGYMIHQAVSHSSGEGLSMEISRPLYLNVGDYVQVGIVQITDADVISGRNYSWFTGYLLS